MANILLNENTRSDASVWYSVTDDGTVVYTSYDLGLATQYYNKAVSEDAIAEVDSVVVLKTYVKVPEEA